MRDTKDTNSLRLQQQKSKNWRVVQFITLKTLYNKIRENSLRKNSQQEFTEAEV